MKKEFRKKLEALAKEYGMEVVDQCVYCGHTKEAMPVADLNEPETGYFITFIKKN